MKKVSGFILVGLFLIIAFQGVTQSVTINGFVRAATSLESLPYATVFDSLSQKGTYCNDRGFFSYSIKPCQEIYLIADYTGYETSSKPLKVTKDTSISFFLNVKTFQTVVVKANRRQGNLQGQEITIAELKQLPVVGGEPDLIKSLTFSPGVASGFEGLSGMFVRGGQSDQNLFLLDGASIYNTGHLFNFVSIYNPLALKKVNFFKGNFPSRYGGRLSSVTDIQFKDGNKTSRKVEASLGLINSSLNIEGPIGKSERLSGLFAARSMYLNLFTLGQRKKVRDRQRDSYSGFNFFDINAKINYEFDEGNKLFFNFYLGKDRLRSLQNFMDINELDKQLTNFTSSFLYYKVLSPKLFFKINGGVGGYFNSDLNFEEIYDFQIFQPTPQNPQQIYRVEYYLRETSELKKRDYTYNYFSKVHFDYAPGLRHNLNFGFESLIHLFQPFEFMSTIKVLDGNDVSETTNVDFSSKKLSGLEAAIYLEDEFQINSRFTLRAGLRYSFFRSVDFFQGELEPRLIFNYSPDQDLSLFVGVNKSTQYVFSFNGFNTEVVSPVWVPASNQHLPQTAWLYSIGSKKHFERWNLDINLEGFYKEMKELKHYSNNLVNAIPYSNWETNLLGGGHGKAYGIEISGIKYWDKLSISSNYTLSWNYRKFEELNGGDWFLSKYDRRHDFNFLVNYKKNKNWTISIAWYFASGHRVTLPVGSIPANNILYNTYSFDGIYNFKLPDYHRLDIAVKWEKEVIRKRKMKWAVNFDVYNVYNRRNINGMYFQAEDVIDNQGNVIEKAGVKGTSLFPLIPSVNVGLKF